MRGLCGCRFLLLSLCALTAPPTGRGLSVSVDPPYWELFPELSSRDGRSLTLEEVLQAPPPDGLWMSLVIGGSVVRLELQQNRALTPDSHSVTHYLADGRPVTRRSQQVACYYHGRVAGRRGPWSGLSLCSGVRGEVILAPDQHFIIEPVPGDWMFRHRLRPIQGNGTATCGTADPLSGPSGGIGRKLLSQEEELPRQLTVQSRRDVASEMKYVELVMVADNSEYKLLAGDLNALHTRMLEIANKMDAYFRELRIRVVLVGVEVWSQKDQIPVSSDPSQSLSRFLSWREKGLLKRIQHDNAQLLTGVKFQGPSVGMATMNSICSSDRSGGVNWDHSVSILGVASTMAHALGHNLGMRHETADRKCGQPSLGKQWIMARSSGLMPGLEFSRCSLQDVETSLRRGEGACLYNFPNPTRVYGEARCGNLLLEAGEQCDCGLALECTDPCCNASSCQLVAGAECASGGLCCDQCKMKVSGSMCREALGECDLPEYCTGDSAHCPANVYLQEGAPCANGVAYCQQGECRTLLSQCQSLWGPGSSPAPEVCFSSLNTRGDKYGNCGGGNGSYLPCAERDAGCGLLQCQGGSGSDWVAVKVKVNGSEVSCRSFSFNPGEDVYDAALVRDGTVCGPGKVCVKQRCLDTAGPGAQSCSNKCGGHGVCNSNNNCHCDPGWAPPDCASYGEGGSTDSGPVALERASRSPAIPILIVLLTAAILLLLCYLKRGFLQKKIGAAFSNSSKCQYRVTQTGSQPRPHRPPPPPHWTQSTELQVMSASNQWDSEEDSDRPAPPCRPLPPDPPLRSLQADAQRRPPAPDRPLPADPRPPHAKVSVPGKPPPPPKKPLPVKPLPRQDTPTYAERVIALPARNAPPPPYTGHTPRA